MRLTICAMVLAAAAVGQAEPGETTTTMNTAEFEQHVIAAGGAADFVFEDDRPFQQCHASTIVQAGNGDIIAAWFAGTEEKNPDVGIWWSVCRGGQWRAPERIAKLGEVAHWNPVLFRDEKDGLHLFFKIGPEIPLWQTYWMSSRDHGSTWTEARELVRGDKGGRGPVRNQPIVLKSGAWLAPSSTEIGVWEPYADRSTDGGRHWDRTPDFFIDRAKMEGEGAIQPTFWESAPGQIHALMRTAAGKVWRSDSEDDGFSWCTLYETELPNNNSGIDLQALEDGRLLLVYNPVSENWGARTPLDLAVSSDNGVTWKTIAHLENDPDPDSEFSYPCIARTEEGVVISYTWQRQRVRAWHIPLAAIPY